MSSRPLKVFLCHAHADRDPMRTLRTRLTKNSVDARLAAARIRSSVMTSVGNRPLKVFLCHAHADRDPVRTLHARLIKAL
jgi:hypothetical protein